MKIPHLLAVALAIALLCCAGCAGRSPTAKSNVIDVYLIGGQSNATGQGYLKNLPAGYTFDPRVLLFNSGRPHLNSGAAPLTWVPLRQASESPDRFGPEIGFGNELQKLYPDRQIALIKHAHSGTNLWSQWSPDIVNPDRPNQFAIFIDTVEKGLQGLRDKGLTPVIRGMIWQQGENDADPGDFRAGHSADYAKNLAHMITMIREHFKAPDMLFVQGYVLSSPKNIPQYPGRDLVRGAEHDMDENSGSPVSMKGVFVVETDDLKTRAEDPNTPLPNDFLHIGTLGQLTLGKRMADKMYQHRVK